MGITYNSEGLSEGDDMHLVTHHATMQGRRQRNYTCFYDADTYVSYWVAYPLCASHISTGREEVWGYDEKVPVEEQTSVKKGYGASIPTANYPKNFYARGHQIPNADRNAVPEMMAQTYFSTNMTPQIQNGMNGGLWAKLEEAVRNETPVSDTLYVITGSTFRVRGDEEIKTIVNKNDGKTLPVPNYYWKAALKVRRTESGLSEAVTIGFWVPHDDLKGRNYTEFAVPVDSLEALTGFDLFVNLPDKMETAAETNGSWETFCAFSR
jgi:endonuclease G